MTRILHTSDIISKDQKRSCILFHTLQVISQAPRHTKNGVSYTSAISTIFEAATQELVKEVHPQMIMSQRGQLLMTAISASISAGRKDTVDVILGIDAITAYLQDQGQPAAHVLSEAICKAEVGSGSAAPAGSVWEAILQHDKCGAICVYPVYQS